MRLPPRFVRHLWLKKFLKDRRAITLVESAIVLPVFLLFLFVLFEVAYDQFLQGVLESTMQLTAYQVQVGNTQNTTDGPTFISKYVCPNAIGGILGCNSVYIRLQQFNTTSCTDFYTETSGALPVSGGKLQLGDYVGKQSIATGNNANIGPANCLAGASTGVGFCNPGPNQYIIMTAIYLAPSFLYGLIPGQGYSYNGSYVHAALATAAFYTENFTAPTSGPQC
jgi:hypothetical protein